MKIVYESQRMYEDITGELKMQKEWKVIQKPLHTHKYDGMEADLEFILNCLMPWMRWETADDKYI